MPSNFCLKQTLVATTLTALAAILATPQKSLAVMQSITFSDTFPGSGGTAITDFTDTLEVSKFDPDLGLLTGISFNLEGLVEGTAKIENTNTTSTSITTELAAELTIASADLTNASGGTLNQIVRNTLIASDTRAVDPFDGEIDFAGASGFTLNNLSNTSTSTFDVTLSDPDFIFFQDVFIGMAGNPENIVLDLIGEASSSVSGSGNIATLLQTTAAANLGVTYIYDGMPTLGSPTASVPFEFSPASGLLLVSGFWGTSYLAKKSRV